MKDQIKHASLAKTFLPSIIDRENCLTLFPSPIWNRFYPFDRVSIIEWPIRHTELQGNGKGRQRINNSEKPSK